MKTYKLCVVRWIDAFGGGNIGWREINSLRESQTKEAISVGYMVNKDKYGITLVPHVVTGDDGKVTHGDAEIVIPNRWIVSKVELDYEITTD